MRRINFLIGCTPTRRIFIARSEFDEYAVIKSVKHFRSAGDAMSNGSHCLVAGRVGRALYQGTLVLLAVCLLGVSSGWARDSEIQGSVTDKSGGVIPRAEVTVKNRDTGVIRNAIANEVEFYAIPLLKEGRYEVTCSNAGFGTAQIAIDLAVGQVVRHDFQLELGQASFRVDVKARDLRIQQQPHSPGTVIEEKQIHELPLDGRNYLTLAGLSPGILRGAQGGRGEQTAPEGGYRSGGLPFDQTSILVDGVDNASRIVRGPLVTQAQTLKPAVEAVSEFKVVTNNVSAEFGYKAGAQVMVSTKGGTNQFHGSLYEFHRNRAFSANNFMFNRDAPHETTGKRIPPPPYIRNQFGGTFGGPIVQNKTFFFFSFQGTRVREGGDSFLSAVPSPLARQGDFSQEIGTAQRGRLIYDPTTSGVNRERTPFPGSIIPQGRMDPVAVRVLDLYPLPNISGKEFDQLNYFRVQKFSNDNEVYDIRVDHNVNDNHRMFGRYSYRNEDSIAGAVLPFPADVSNIAEYRGYQVAVNYHATVGPRMHNELRFGYTHFPNVRTDEYTENLNGALGVKNAVADRFPDLVDGDFKNGLVRFGFEAAYQAVGGDVFGTTATLNTLYIAENFQISVGNHSFKFGGEFRSWSSDRTQGSGFGEMNFSGGGKFTARFPNFSSQNATGHPLADALLGWTARTGNGLPTGEDIINPYWGVYIQDDWRVTNRLTINMGLRWELFMQARPRNLDPLRPVAKAVFSGFPFDETSAVIPIRFERWEFPQSEGDCGCILDKKNFAPRLGIAYRLTDNTLVRAGAGYYYSENGVAGEDTNRFQPGGPNVTSLDTFSTNATTEVFVRDGFPLFELTEGDPTIYANGGVTNIPDFKPTISSAQWFLDIQHQLPWDILLTLGYNGQAQSHMPWWLRNVAAPTEPGLTSAFARRRTPPASESNTRFRLNNFRINDNILNANYNAFTAKVEKRFSDGLSFLSSFTWSKTLDYGVSSRNERGEGVTGGGQPQSPHIKDIWRNRGPSGLSRDFAWSLSTIYELPIGPGKGRLQSGPASWILGGWQVGAILSMQSGPWVSTAIFPNLAQAGGTYRGNLVGEINLPESERDSMRWFDRTAIVRGPSGEHGDVGRGVLEAPGFKNFDFLASKDFPLPWEGHRLQFRFEAFNFTNTPHLAAPSNRTSDPLTAVNVNNPNSVRILRADDPRIIQFALKYLF